MGIPCVCLQRIEMKVHPMSDAKYSIIADLAVLSRTKSQIGQFQWYVPTQPELRGTLPLKNLKFAERDDLLHLHI